VSRIKADDGLGYVLVMGDAGPDAKRTLSEYATSSNNTVREVEPRPIIQSRVERAGRGYAVRPSATYGLLRSRECYTDGGDAQSCGMHDLDPEMSPRLLGRYYGAVRDDGSALCLLLPASIRPRSLVSSSSSGHSQVLDSYA